MNYFKTFLIMAFIIGCANKQESPGDLNSLIEAERSFAGASARKGIREAFLNCLADEAIIFRPKPIAAKPFYLDQKKIPGSLTWEPEFADISLAGDLGYTTGPYEFRNEKNSKNADMRGHYVSIWKKQQDGNWRVVIDCGIVHPGSTAPVIPDSILQKQHRSSIRTLTTYEINNEKRTLLDTDLAFYKATANEGIGKIFLDYNDDQARYYRMNTYPVIGKENICDKISSEVGNISGTPLAAEIAISGDLGYTYGLSELNLGDETRANSYLRIWKKSSDSRWRVVLDLENPIPSK